MHFKLKLSIILFFLIYALSNVTVLCIIGFYAVHYYFVENFESIVRIGINLFRNYLYPHKNVSLKERFGDWAGVRHWLSFDTIWNQFDLIIIR